MMEEWQKLLVHCTCNHARGLFTFTRGYFFFHISSCRGWEDVNFDYRRKKEERWKNGRANIIFGNYIHPCNYLTVFFGYGRTGKVCQKKSFEKNKRVCQNLSPTISLSNHQVSFGLKVIYKEITKGTNHRKFSLELKIT